MTDRYADADPEETVTVEGVGHMMLRRGGWWATLPSLPHRGNAEECRK